MSAIAVLGGGPWVVQLIELLARACPAGVEVRLAARRFERTELIARHAAARVSARALRVTACASIERAVRGADVVAILVRIGGLAARAHDEKFPRAFGLAGDEGLGAGGFANAYRSLPALEQLARVIRREAPGAAVFNLVAPLGITTRMMIEEGVQAIGVCELPRVTLEKVPGGDRADYVGLNHVGWFWPTAPKAGPEVGDPETVARFGAAPLRYYYEVFDRPAARRLGLTEKIGRAAQLSEVGDALAERFATAPGVEPPEMALRSMPWFERALVPMIAARLGGPIDDGFANFSNGCSISGLPPETVIELRARTQKSGTDAIKPSTDIPAPVLDFLARLAAAESVAYRAARSRTPALLCEAFAALPVTPPVPAGALDGLVSAALEEIR